MTATHSLTILTFFVSACVVAYQVFLARLLALVQWHHLAFMVISIAMLGFGAAGALLAARELRRRRAASSDDPRGHSIISPAYPTPELPPWASPPATQRPDPLTTRELDFIPEYEPSPRPPYEPNQAPPQEPSPLPPQGAGIPPFFRPTPARRPLYPEVFPGTPCTADLVYLVPLPRSVWRQTPCP